MNLGKAGLNWTIKKVPIIVNGKESAYFNLLRSDTNYVMGNCTSKYEVLQNADFVKQTLASAFEHGFSVNNYEAGKVDKNGRQVYVKIDTGTKHPIGSDTIHEHITVLHYHDGRPVDNQSFCTYDISRTLSFNIEMVASKSIEDVTCLKCAKDIIKNLKQLTTFKVGFADLDVLIDKLTNPDNVAMTAKRQGQRDRLDQTINSKNPASAWDVFKAIVEFAETLKSSKDRKASMFMGSSAKMVETAYSFLTKLSQK